MTNNNKYIIDFESFMEVRLKASTDFVEGKFDSLENISVKKSPATIFPPSGICVQDAEQVNYQSNNYFFNASSSGYSGYARR